ncbi:hypothetical protein YC2023_095877 [Brassica napus]
MQIYANYEKKLQEIFILIHDVPSNMDIIGRLGVAQSDPWGQKYKIKIRRRKVEEGGYSRIITKSSTKPCVGCLLDH